MGGVATGGLLRHPGWGHINPILDFLAKLEIINGNVSKGYASVPKTEVADKKSSFKQIQEKPCTPEG